MFSFTVSFPSINLLPLPPCRARVIAVVIGIVSVILLIGTLIMIRAWINLSPSLSPRSHPFHVSYFPAIQIAKAARDVMEDARRTSGAASMSSLSVPLQLWQHPAGHCGGGVPTPVGPVSGSPLAGHVISIKQVRAHTRVQFRNTSGNQRYAFRNSYTNDILTRDRILANCRRHNLENGDDDDFDCEASLQHPNAYHYDRFDTWKEDEDIKEDEYVNYHIDVPVVEVSFSDPLLLSLQSDKNGVVRIPVSSSGNTEAEAETETDASLLSGAVAKRFGLRWGDSSCLYCILDMDPRTMESELNLYSNSKLDGYRGESILNKQCVASRLTHCISLLDLRSSSIHPTDLQQADLYPPYFDSSDHHDRPYWRDVRHPLATFVKLQLFKASIYDIEINCYSIPFLTSHSISLSSSTATSSFSCSSSSSPSSLSSASSSTSALLSSLRDRAVSDISHDLHLLEGDLATSIWRDNVDGDEMRQEYSEEIAIQSMKKEYSKYLKDVASKKIDPVTDPVEAPAQDSHTR